MSRLLIEGWLCLIALQIDALAAELVLLCQIAGGLWTRKPLGPMSWRIEGGRLAATEKDGLMRGDHKEWMNDNKRRAYAIAQLKCLIA